MKILNLIKTALIIIVSVRTATINNNNYARINNRININKKYDFQVGY